MIIKNFRMQTALALNLLLIGLVGKANFLQISGLTNQHGTLELLARRSNLAEIQYNEIRKERASGQEFFEAKLNETLECFKKVLQTPNPKSGILYDPWTKNETFKAEVDNIILLTRDLYASNVAFRGLSNFDVLSLTLSEDMVQETVIRVNKLELTGDYDDDMNWLGMLNAAGKGKFKMSWSNFEMKVKIVYNNQPPLIRSVTVTGLSQGRPLIRLTGVYNDEEFSIYFSALVTTLTQQLLDMYYEQGIQPLADHIQSYLSDRIGDMTYLDFLGSVASFECSL